MLRPNTILLGWSARPFYHGISRRSSFSSRLDHDIHAATELLVAVKKAIQFDKALLIFCTPHAASACLRGAVGQFRLSGRGCIDVWWLDHSNSLPLLIADLLQRHETLARCSLRIFAPLDESAPGSDGRQPNGNTFVALKEEQTPRHNLRSIAAVNGPVKHVSIL